MSASYSRAGLDSDSILIRKLAKLNPKLEQLLQELVFDASL